MRTHVTVPPTKGAKPAALSPYPAGSSFFFKVKYDEPYMMYRDWREITKTLLGAKVPIRDVSIPKSKLRRPESKVYLNWVRDEILRDRKQFATYNQGIGIIATRQRFLHWLKDKEQGASLERLTESLDALTINKNDVEFGKTVIVPVAIPGCGQY